MKNYNPAMKKSGLKGSFPKGSGGSLSTGLSSREALSADPESLGMGNSGPNQTPIRHPEHKAG
jgi:hypothetical protein